MLADEVKPSCLLAALGRSVHVIRQRTIESMDPPKQTPSTARTQSHTLMQILGFRSLRFAGVHMTHYLAYCNNQMRADGFLKEGRTEDLLIRLIYTQVHVYRNALC